MEAAGWIGRIDTVGAEADHLSKSPSAMLHLPVDDDGGYHTWHQAELEGLAGAFLREAAQTNERSPGETRSQKSLDHGPELRRVVDHVSSASFGVVWPDVSG